ncbi:hypothetical protein [Haloarchaeobius sp. DT45]|uniref:hypothetical protein n=1 Tax=Haloarchaeobius sp. DT45 TaxID=3446116 RepID=UPI003F6AD8C5
MGKSSREVSKRNLLAGVGVGLIGGLAGYRTTTGRVSRFPAAMRLETGAGGEKRTSGAPTVPTSQFPHATIELTCTDLTVTVEPRSTSFYLRTRHRDDVTDDSFNCIHGPYEGTVTDSFENLTVGIVDVEVFWNGNILAWGVRPDQCESVAIDPDAVIGPVEVDPGPVPEHTSPANTG